MRNQAENRAFIFDMDGVIVNSEPEWECAESEFLPEILGREVYLKIKDQILGSTTDTIYEAAAQNGARISKGDFLAEYDRQAVEVYRNSPLTPGIDVLMERLVYLNFKLGLVTASRPFWIQQVLPRLRKPEYFQSTVSLAENKTLRPKPFPDGYTEAMRQLNCLPNRTIILEDSNRGIQSAKASNALTICLRENLPVPYISSRADMYVDSLVYLLALTQLL